LIVIPIGNRFLALSEAEFEAALERGKELVNPVEQPYVEHPEPLLTAEEAAELTRLPKQWLLEAARQGRVPHYRLGKYVRFKQSELEASGRQALSTGGRRAFAV
jgi:excisionase family DNA binding protein